jgi:hypothetical protein
LKWVCSRHFTSPLPVRSFNSDAAAMRGKAFN